MKYIFYKCIQDYVHGDYSQEKNIILREFTAHVAMKKELTESKYKSSILELACGGGNLADLFPSDLYLGIDINKERVGAAIKKHPFHSFRVLDINTKEFEDLLKNFDFIFCHALLHHLDDVSCRTLIKRIKNFAPKPTTFLAMEPVLPNMARNLIGYILCKLDKGRYIRTPEHYRSLFIDGYLTIKKVNSSLKYPVEGEVYVIRYKE